MSKIIYWACNENEWLRAKNPEPVYKNFIKDLKDKDLQMEFCSAIKDYMHNMFSIKSLYDYNFKLEKNTNQTKSDVYNQSFFDEHIFIRSQMERCFSFTQKFIFFTEEKSLLISGGILPFLEDNNITKRCTVIPGTFDIGKWFRPLDFVFYLKKDYDEFKIEEEEIFQYIKFDTKEKIIFKQFKINSKIKEVLLDSDNAKNFRKQKLRNLKEYYSMLKNKKYIISLIKENLLD